MFSVTRNYFRNGKQLARKGGGESASNVGAFRQTAPPRTNRNFHKPARRCPHLKNSIMEKNRPTRKGRGGRPAKDNPAIYRFSVNFSAQEHARFLTMYEQSRLLSKAAFIKARVFEDVFRVIKTDRGTLEYVAKLTQLHAQYRARQRTKNCVPAFPNEKHCHCSTSWKK